MNEPVKDGITHVDDVLTIVRYFAAPRELVFRMWTEAEHFAQWFGPASGCVPHCSIDARPGGVMHFCVEEPRGSGQVVWCKGVFREVVAPERLVFDDYFSDEDGNIVERPGFALQNVIHVFLEPHEGGTKMTVRHEGLKVDQGEIQGWTDSFDRLAKHVATEDIA